MNRIILMLSATAPLISLGWDLNVVFLPYDNEHRRKQRRWIQGAFGDRIAVQRLEALRERETCILLSSLMSEPEGFKHHIKRYVPFLLCGVNLQSADENARYMAALIMESVYGHRIVSLDDEYIDLIDRAMEAQGSTQFTGSILVDFFPSRTFLCMKCQYVPCKLTAYSVKYIPGMEWKRFGIYAGKLIDEAKTKPYIMARESVVRISRASL